MTAAPVMRMLLALALLLAGPAAARWRVAESPHFRIYSEAGPDRLTARAAALEDYHKLLLMLTGVTWPEDAPKLDIYVVSSPGVLRIVHPKLGSDIVGFYTSRSSGIFAMSTDGAGLSKEWMSGQEVLLHEYAHHFMHQVSRTALPRWYVEGFAEYLMTAEFRTDRIEFADFNKSRAYSLAVEPWLPLERVLTQPKKGEIDAFYAQSWLLTHYMNRMPGMADKLRAYLVKVGQGTESVAAFKETVAGDLQSFERDLRRYTSGGKFTKTRFTRQPQAPDAIVIRELSPAADSILLPLLSMTQPQEAATDARNLARIRQAAAQHPDDPWAQRALAIAEAIGGKPEVGAALLDAQLAKTPDDPELLRWRATLYRPADPKTDMADVKAARRLLARAFKAAPTDWQVLLAYVQSFAAHGELPPTVRDVLWRANELAPQVAELGMMAGEEFARAGDLKRGYQVMAQFVYSPHGNAPSEPMQRYMESLRQGDKAAADAARSALPAHLGKPDAEEDAAP